ncbi:hypothetical protein WSS_A43129 [Rhodococcus opacus M213]|uniref:Uncharacterized protein n=1 Tax=Rhodococcus opacus M213 TaxID=1129896 RepID=K8X4A5_RHOOP|nr:hypothetical protein WSS_A43129 [Rhodococcus opacus M213]
MAENTHQFCAQASLTFQRGIDIPEDIHREFAHVLTNPVRMASEADPLLPGTRLHEVLFPVVAAAESLHAGEISFRVGVKELETTTKSALASLPAIVSEPPTSEVHEVIDELERAFLLSLLTTLTAQSYVIQTVSNWETEAQGAAKKGQPQPGRYLDVSELEFAKAPGNGRIHIQHLIAAIDAGIASGVAGGGFVESTRYPELQIVLYGQWFTYFHAIWDEQIRHRLAAAHGCKPADISIPFFGDVRLIRNDFVHKKGIAGKSATSAELLAWFKKGEPMQIAPERMLSLIRLFPRADLEKTPAPRERTRQAVGGSIPIELDEQVGKRMDQLGISDRNQVMEQALQMWLGDGVIGTVRTD